MSLFKINKIIKNLPTVKPYFIYRFICFTCLLTPFACNNSDKIKPNIETKPQDSIPNPNDSNFNPPTLLKPNVPFYLKSIYNEPADNPNTLEGVALGKILFFDKRLSADNTISCSTCHRPEKAFTDGIPLAVGIQNKIGKRNTPGLFNLAIQKKFFWDGRVNSLEDQSIHPIQDPNEMSMELEQLISKLKSISEYPNLFGRAFGSSEISIDRVAKALAQFQRSLFSQTSKYDLYLKGEYNLTIEELKGMTLFFQHPTAGSVRGGNCGDCHLPQTLSGKLDDFDGFHNTGLTELNSQDIGLKAITGKASDFGKFKTPDLRNVALTAPYMHDGRFQTLEQVLDHYNSESLFSKPNVDVLITAGRNEVSFDPIYEQSLKLTTAEKKSIITFLHTLTDTLALKFNP
jgi:cytochrome c peroxidase